MSERHEFTKGMHDWSFVRTDRVRSEFERSLQMLDRGLTGLRIERTGLKQNICPRFFQPLAYVAANMDRRSGPVAVQNGEWIQAIGVGYPAGPARGDTGETPAHVIAAAQL